MTRLNEATQRMEAVTKLQLERRRWQRERGDGRALYESILAFCSLCFIPHSFLPYVCTFLIRVPRSLLVVNLSPTD